MNSNNWDYNEQQSDLLLRYFSMKYIEQLNSYLDELRQMKAFADKKKYDNCIKESEISINKVKEILTKIPKRTDEELWKDSLTCVGCLHSFENRLKLIEHVRKHLIKLGILPKDFEEKQ